MRNFPAALQAALRSDAATFCHCWRLVRPDGLVMGFTDHDHDITFDGTTFRAATGLAGSDMETATGLNDAGMEVAGALSASELTEADLAAGKYDDAKVEVWLVDWRNPTVRALLRVGRVGRVRRGQVHFEAELRALAAPLQRVRGRTFAHGCDADLGDARCGVDLADPAYNGTGTVQAVHGPTIVTSGLQSFASGFFTHGRIRITSGAAAGFRAVVKSHRRQGDDTLLELAEPPPPEVAAGDLLKATAGCDRSFHTCRDRFANVVNFRGFPHMPGNDFGISYPNRGDPDNDGGSMNR